LFATTKTLLLYHIRPYISRYSIIYTYQYLSGGFRIGWTGIGILIAPYLRGATPESIATSGTKRIEIVQKDEVRDFDVRKEVVTSPEKVTDYTRYLYDLHMLAADMCIEEKYAAGSDTYVMDGYSVETEQLIDGRFIATITLYTARQTET